MADGIVWNLASKALEVLGIEAVWKAASWWGARDDLQKLGETIRTIQARVRDAERRQEGESSHSIKRWLQRLRLVLYRADDLFDEVLTLDYLKQQRMEKSMLCKVGILFTKSGPLCYNRKLANEIKAIRKELDDIKSNMDGLHLVEYRPEELPMARLMENRETSSFVIQEKVTGREKDQNNIIKMLLDPQENREQMTVISIVGFGGLGKTTLAQLVFNDERVQEHFDLTRWAYVPEIDNKIVIMRKVYRSLTNENYDNLSMEQIQQGIRESIKNKKYLLVLDDIWHEGDDIKELLNLLKGGTKHGSKVIVTTRSDVVAKHFGPIDAAYKLGALTDVQSWELFSKLAFGPGHEENNPALSKIGKQIVKMCKNVPLAIKIIGGSLCSKHTAEEWLQVKNDLSKAQLAENDKITAVLKLSYDNLSPKSKLCFAYCSLFPKGYEFVKDELVRLWMAQGYVELDKGGQYFLDLVSRNLFQGFKVSHKRNAVIYKMHDLLQDLAQEVAGDESKMCEHPDQIHDQLVHVNLNGSKSPPLLKDVNKLRSLLCIAYNANDEKLYSKSKSLRVLSMKLSGGYKKLSNSIGRLIHLRYLNLHSKAIEYLPNSITRLVNLQTLDVQSCTELKELPREFAKLVNLRHLFLPCEKLASLPPGFGKLTSLQELHWLILREGNGIDELSIWFCAWRRDAIEEVKMANLENNHQLSSLKLLLGCAGEMNEILRCLQLPPNLTNLEVWNSIGDEMPVRWLDGLSHLVSIVICNCRECKVLPKLSGLPHLKSLQLSHLDELEYVEDEDNIRVGTASATHNRCFFPSLQFLDIKCCYKLKGWRKASKDEGERRQLVFPCLLKMEVHWCPMFMSMPVAPTLESLSVHGIYWKIAQSNVGSNDDNEEAAASSSSAPPSSSSSILSMSLKELEIERVNDGLITLSVSSSLCNLSVLKIRECSELRNLRVESSNYIRKLEISNCSRLKDISEGLQHLCGLEELDIEDCEQLVLEEEEEQEEEGKSCSCWQGLSSLLVLKLDGIPKVKMLPRGIAYLTTLQELKVRNMEKLREIPEEIGNLSLLRVLSIVKCPEVKSLPPSILGLPMLQELHLEKMEKLREIPEEIGNLSLLRVLSIVKCPEMKSLPPSILRLPMLQELHLEKMENLTELPADEIGNGTLPLLRDLQIKNCPKVKSLPSIIQGLASLQYLGILGCPDLGKKNMPGGEDWHLIQHIPILIIHDGSKVYKRRDGKEPVSE